MKSPGPLSGSQLRTYERIFQHPISHNLGWHDVLGMFRQLGTVEVEPNGNMKVTRNGQFTVLRPHHSKDVAEMEEVIALRHFLELTEAKPSATESPGTHWLVVIDHHKARLFRSEMSGSIPQEILPYEPTEYFRHAHESRDFSRGKEKPDPNTFFAPVADALKAAGPIVIFGSGTGESSEMAQFTSCLKTHHPDISERVLGAITVDEQHLSEGQLLQRAREFYASIEPAPV